MRKTLIAALIALPLVATAAPTPMSLNPTSLVVNGSFELTPTPLSNGNWTNYKTLAGWTISPTLGIEVRNNAEGAAFDGKNFVELDTTGNAAISQAFNTLSAGSEYLLRFQYSPRIGQRPETNTIAAYWNGAQLGSFTGQGGSAHSWSEFSFRVRAIGGTNTLGFGALGVSDSVGGSLDNVRLNAIPEPASLGLALAGVAGVVLMRRRRQA